jgi:probable selenium-dependent hydroxylase accessory protein YqeC
VNELLQYRDVWLIGGGGKTTLMFRLAAAWVARHETVLCTTTTQIFPPTAEQCPDLRVDSLEPLVAGLRQRPAPMVTVASRIKDGKCFGFSGSEALSLKSEAQRLVVEADGSAGLPVKAHAPHEPVLATAASCVAAVVGSWCVGVPLDADHVHRPERFAALSGRPLGSAVSAADVANVILHEEGWLLTVPPIAAFHVVVTGSDTGIIRALERHPRASRLAGVCWASRSCPHANRP